MNASPGPETIRLTMAQAVVKYLQAQYSERDGERRRLIPAMFGIFGHGNVCGMGQALEECGAGPAVLPALQRAVDGAHGDRLRQGEPSAGHAGLHGVDRARLDQHDHGRGRGDDQPPAGAACSPPITTRPGIRGRCSSSSSTRSRPT